MMIIVNNMITILGQLIKYSECPEKWKQKIGLWDDEDRVIEWTIMKWQRTLKERFISNTATKI